MEIEYFVKPGTDEEWHKRWLDDRMQWYKDLGIRPENLLYYLNIAVFSKTAISSS